MVQQSQTNLNLSGQGPSILLAQDRSVAQKPHWGFRCFANANFFLRNRWSKCPQTGHGLGAILVVERDQHPVIVQENGIYKNFNQRFPLLFPRNIELSKFHQPESDEILIEARLLQLFVCNFAISSSFWISSASRRSFVVRVYKPSSIAFIRLSSFLLTSRSCFSSSGIVVFS